MRAVPFSASQRLCWVRGLTLSCSSPNFASAGSGEGVAIVFVAAPRRPSDTPCRESLRQKGAMKRIPDHTRSEDGRQKPTADGLP